MSSFRGGTDCQKVNQKVYQNACDKLFTGYGDAPTYGGKIRQELQKIKHANDFKQKGYNPYGGPEDKSKDAQAFLDGLS